MTVIKNDPKIDSERANRVPVVLRARFVRLVGGQKDVFDEISVVAVLKNESHHTFAGAGLAAMPKSPFTKAVIMSVPFSAAFRPFGRLPHSGRLAAKLPRQLLLSWYIMYFQLPWLPDRSASWVIPKLWRKWSPGYAASRRESRSKSSVTS